jgi:protein TonB
MRKVYQNDGASYRLPVATFFGVGITAILFGVLPFSHIVNRPTETFELRKANAVDLPPPPDDQETPPTVEAEKPPETAKEPQLAETQQQIAISADLEVAAGSGGALAGFGEVRALTQAENVQQDAFDVSELEKRPEAVSQVPPAYPPELRKARIEGSVTLVFILSEEGRVEEPRVENSTRPEFEKPALDAIKRWRFQPGMKDGKAVRSYIRIPMRFRVAGS